MGSLVKHLRIPLEYVRLKASFLARINFCYRVPQPGVPQVTESIPFYSLILTDKVFESTSTKYVLCSSVCLLQVQLMYTALLNYLHNHPAGMTLWVPGPSSPIPRIFHCHRFVPLKL